MRKKKHAQLFSFSFIDIMTSLLIISMIFLFTSTSLFSILPINIEITESILQTKDSLQIYSALYEIKSQSLFDQNQSIDDIKNNIYNSLKSNGLSETNLFNLFDNSISSQEDSMLLNLSNRTSQLQINIDSLKNELTNVEDVYSKRKQEWLDELFVTNNNFIARTGKSPSFYSYNGTEFHSLKDGIALSSKDIVNFHSSVDTLHYPLIIIEPSGFSNWSSIVRELESISNLNSLPFGYEPYNKDLDFLYEALFMKKP